MNTALAKYKRDVQFVVARSQLRTAVALTICVGAVLETALYSLHLLHSDSQWLSILMAYGGPWLIGIALIAWARRTGSGNVMSEAGGWYFLCFGFVLSPVIPAVLACAVAYMQAPLSQQGRYRIVRNLGLLRGMWSVRRVSYFGDLVCSLTADAIFNSGDFTEGIALAKITAQRTLQSFHQNPSEGPANAFASAQCVLVRLLAKHGLVAQAEDAVSELVKAESKFADLQPLYQVIAFDATGSALSAVGHYEAAIQYSERAEESLALITDAPFDLDLIKASLAEDLAEAYWTLGRFEEAEERANECIRKWEKVAGKSSIRAATGHQILGELALMRGHVDLALNEFAIATAIRQVRAASAHPESAKSIAGYVRCLEAKGDKAQAEELRDLIKLIESEHHRP